MQIRIGNKQDEPGCRELVKNIAHEFGAVFDLQTSDDDLKNIEASYIGRDGIFLAIENGETIVGFAAAARGATDEICLLKRVYVHSQFRRAGLGYKLIDKVIFFARNLEYKYLRLYLDSEQASKYALAESFLCKNGFVLKTPAGVHPFLESNQSSASDQLLFQIDLQAPNSFRKGNNGN